jgi:surface polysaccharide O-acyltransferase-like enzyme
VHLFRGGSIALVVLAHAKLAVTWPEPTTIDSRLLRALIEGGDIPFFFLAGFLFQFTSAGFSYGPYLASRFRNVVLPYLFCSAPILLHAYVFRYGVFEGFASRSSLSIAADLLESLLTAQHMFVPLWFIPTIVVLYGLSPALLWIDRRPGLYAGVPLALVVGSMLHLAPLYHNVLRDAADVLPVFVFGMAVSHHRAAVFAALRRRPLVAPSLLLALLAAEVAFGPSGRFASVSAFSPENGPIDLSYLQKALLSLIAFERLEQAGPAHSLVREGVERAFARLGDLSFGIFFFHMYVLDFAMRPVLSRFLGIPRASALAVATIGIVCLTATTGLVLFAKRVLAGRSRVMIGC